MPRSTFESVSEYIAAQPKPAQRALKQVRDIFRKALPEAEEQISYQIPTYKQDGRPIVYFAGFKSHYSVYPVTEELTAKLGKQIERYKEGRGTLRFPLDEPVPVKLLQRVAKLRVAENEARKKKR